MGAHCNAHDMDAARTFVRIVDEGHLVEDAKTGSGDDALRISPIPGFPRYHVVHGNLPPGAMPFSASRGFAFSGPHRMTPAATDMLTRATDGLAPGWYSTKGGKWVPHKSVEVESCASVAVVDLRSMSAAMTSSGQTQYDPAHHPAIRGATPGTTAYGLFATQTIQRGELICDYCEGAVVYAAGCTAKCGGECPACRDMESHEPELLLPHLIYLCEVPLPGRHGSLSINGNPLVSCGCMINDVLNKVEVCTRGCKACAAYSGRRPNAEFGVVVHVRPPAPPRVMLCVWATRTIPAGTEVLCPYGAGYWLSHDLIARRESERDVFAPLFRVFPSDPKREEEWACERGTLFMFNLCDLASGMLKRGDWKAALKVCKAVQEFAGFDEAYFIEARCLLMSDVEWDAGTIRRLIGWINCSNAPTRARSFVVGALQAISGGTDQAALDGFRQALPDGTFDNLEEKLHKMMTYELDEYYVRNAVPAAADQLERSLQLSGHEEAAERVRLWKRHSHGHPHVDS